MYEIITAVEEPLSKQISRQPSGSPSVMNTCSKMSVAHEKAEGWFNKAYSYIIVEEKKTIKMSLTILFLLDL